MASDEKTVATITSWFHQLREGDEEAARQLWNEYFDRLVQLAKRRMTGRLRRAADEEDVALSVFDTICRRAGRGEFQAVDNRDDLWRLLVTVTQRKIVARARREHAQKRGGGELRGESVFGEYPSGDGNRGIGLVAGAAPTPEFIVAMEEEQQRLLNQLDDEMLVRIAVARMEGESVEEIARKLDFAPRTIERKLNRIRDRWSGELENLEDFDS